MNLHPYLNHMVQLTLRNGDTLCGVLLSEVSRLKQCTFYYLDGSGSRSYFWYADGVHWKLSPYGEDHDKDVREISKFEVTLPESHSVSKPKIEDPVYWDIQNSFPLGKQPSTEQSKKILETILDRPELFWRTFSFFDTDVIEDTKENREVYFHIMQRINLWLYKAMHDCDTGTFENSFFKK